ncbi:unnamed protein product [Closterium sp. Naga37s-1]|nr:unnamed protein product [Closterium sp. Naga37s-1]
MISSSIVSSSPLQNAALQSNISNLVTIDSPASSSASTSHFRSQSFESFAPPSKVRRLDGHFSPLENPKETEGLTEEEGVKEKGQLFHQLRSSAPAFSRDLADSSHLLLDAEPCHARGSSPKPSLASLPSELVRVIVSLVDAPRDRGCCALVCRAWRQWERATRTQLHLRGSLSDLPSLGTCFDSVTDLDLADVHPDWPGSEEELRQVFRTSFPNLRRVRANVSPSGLEYVRQCWPKLENIVIGHWDGLDEGLEARHVSSLVSRCPKVDSIDLSWSRHCDFNELPKQLSDYKLGRIRVLNLLGGPAPLRDDALEVFGRGAFPGLEELSFAMADGGVTDMGIASVARGCPALRVLRIEDVAHDLNDSDEGDADGVADGVADGDGIGDTEDAAVDGPWGAFGGSVAAAVAVVSEATVAAAAAAADAAEVEQVDIEGLDEYVPFPPAATTGISAVALASTLGPSPLPQSSPSPTSTAFLAAAATLAAVAGIASVAAATPPAQFATLAPALPPPVPTACPTYPITAAALESLARHCPSLEELCLVPSFCVHRSGPAVEALAAGCKSLRVLRLTRFLGLGRGVLAVGEAVEGVAQRGGGQEEQEEQEKQEEQEAVKQEEQSQQFQQQEMQQQQQQQAQQWDGQFGSASPCAPFVDEPLSFPLAADNGGNPDGSNLDGGNPDGGNLDGGNLDGGNLDGGNLDGGNLQEWMQWDSAPSLLPPTLDGFSSGWEVDDSLLADLQQWQQLQAQQQPQQEEEQQQQQGGLLVAAAASLDTYITGSTSIETSSTSYMTNSFAACPSALPCTSGCTSTDTSTSTTGSPRVPPSPRSQPPILPPLAQFAALEELELQMCSDMTDRDVQAVLEGCPKLRRLEVVANHRLSARAFALGCAVCAAGGQCEVAAAGGSCRARGRALESVRVMQCDNVDSHALLHALMPARTTLKGIQMTASWTHTSPPLPLACFSALESLCLEVSVDASLSPLLSPLFPYPLLLSPFPPPCSPVQPCWSSPPLLAHLRCSAGLASCPNLKFFFLSLYGALEQDTLPLPPHHYSLAFLSQPPALTYLFLSLEGVQSATAPALASLELALLASCPSLAIQEIEFRPAPCPVASAPLCLDLLSPDAARLLSLSPCLRRVTLGGVVQEPAMVKLLRSRTLRDVVFLTPPDCSDTFRSFFESVLKSRGYTDQPRSGAECGLDGASIIYWKFLYPQIKKHEDKIDSAVSAGQKRVMRMKDQWASIPVTSSSATVSSRPSVAEKVTSSSATVSSRPSAAERVLQEMEAGDAGEKGE